MSRPDNAPKQITEVSAGGVVFRERDGEPYVLLIRDRYGHWGLPKGHIERGETPSEAALREVREETGLRRLVLGASLRTIEWRFRSDRGVIHKICHFYLVEAPEGEVVPQVEEGITECQWLAIDDAVRRISYRNAAEVIEEAATVLRGGTRGAG